MEERLAQNKSPLVWSTWQHTTPTSSNGNVSCLECLVVLTCVLATRAQATQIQRNAASSLWQSASSLRWWRRRIALVCNRWTRSPKSASSSCSLKIATLAYANRMDVLREPASPIRRTVSKGDCAPPHPEGGGMFDIPHSNATFSSVNKPAAGFVSTRLWTFNRVESSTSRTSRATAFIS